MHARRQRCRVYSQRRWNGAGESMKCDPSHRSIKRNDAGRIRTCAIRDEEISNLPP
jgi:hypothetical protein